jgi:hypothetical protein
MAPGGGDDAAILGSILTDTDNAGWTGEGATTCTNDSLPEPPLSCVVDLVCPPSSSLVSRLGGAAMLANDEEVDGASRSEVWITSMEDARLGDCALGARAGAILDAAFPLRPRA